jgi:hypothetical protein
LFDLSNDGGAEYDRPVYKDITTFGIYFINTAVCYWPDCMSLYAQTNSTVSPRAKAPDKLAQNHKIFVSNECSI